MVVRLLDDSALIDSPLWTVDGAPLADGGGDPSIRSMVHGVVADPAGHPIAGALITITLARRSDMAFVESVDTEIVPPAKVKSAPDGTWSALLWGNDALTPSGSVYQATYRTGGHTFPPFYFRVDAGGGTYWVHELEVDIEPVVLTSIAITPENAQPEVGDTVNMVATGTYSDGTTAVITADVSWTTSDPTVASIANSGPSKGTVTAVSKGGVLITATDPVTVVTFGVLLGVHAIPTSTFHGWMQCHYTTTTHDDLLRMLDLGVEGLRMTIPLQQVAANGNAGNPLNGIDYNFGGRGAILGQAHDLGFEVCAVAVFTPRWLMDPTVPESVKSSGHQIPQTSGTQDDYAEILAAVQVHYGSVIDQFEIGNELNHHPFNYLPTLATLRPFMKKCVLALRANDANAFIIPSGGASGKGAEMNAKWDVGANYPSTGPGDQTISQATMLDGWFGPIDVAPDGTGIVPGNTPGTAWVNAYAIHGYTGGNTPLYNYFENPSSHAFVDMPGIGRFSTFGSAGFNYYDDIIVAREGAGNTKQIWNTEGGFAGMVNPAKGPTMAYSLTLARAAEYLGIYLDFWRTMQHTLGPGGVGKAGPYQYLELDDAGVTNIDGSRATSNPEDYTGMNWRSVSNALTPKPQAATWVSYTNP